MEDRRHEHAVSPTPPAVDEGNRATRLWRGASYLWRGWRLLSSDRTLLLLGLGPLMGGCVAFGAVILLLLRYRGVLMTWLWQRPDALLLLAVWYLAYVTLLVSLALAGLVLAYVLQSILAAPFNDAISERVERRALGRAAATPWFRGAEALLVAMLHEGKKAALALLAAGGLFLLSFIPVLGVAVSALGGYYVAARFVAYDALDHCMARRHWSFARKRRFLRAHRVLTFGFGGAVALIFALPAVGLIASPVASAGGTLLFCDLLDEVTERRPPEA